MDNDIRNSNYLIYDHSSIQEALELITDNHRGEVVVVNTHDELVGVVSDGDLRRAMVKGATHATPVRVIANLTPIKISDQTKDRAQVLSEFPNINVFPVLDKDNKVVDIIVRGGFFKADRDRSEKFKLDYLQQLEAESIHIIRETAANFQNPVMMYSIGKDSSVLLRLAQKAFAPAKIPFRLLHVDTGFKFKEMIEFRDRIVEANQLDLIVAKNEEPQALNLKPEEAATDHYIFLKKTKPLLEALAKYNFDAAIGGARREEEKSRAKERIFSVRSGAGVWDPKNQRPELWNLYNTLLTDHQTMRVFPLSNWTEADIWAYILRENIEIVPLYFAQSRAVVKRNGILLRLDEFVKVQAGEEVINLTCRYRTLGCSPSTGAVPSAATTVEEILAEVINAKSSERENRAIDQVSSTAMEQKKKEGYF